MSRYKRLRQRGGCYFFTVVTYQRFPYFRNNANIERLRKAISHVKHRKPFHIDGIVILPDHIHCVWWLPDNDSDNSSRWAQIKRRFSMSLDESEKREFSRKVRRERAIWQPRFWEHLIVDDEDWRRHMDYIHYNPVKHGLVRKVSKWPYSSFSRCIQRGWYLQEWGDSVAEDVINMDIE